MTAGGTLAKSNRKEAKKGGAPPQPAAPPAAQPAADDDNVITTIKARRWFARMIRKVGAMLDVNQEDVLERYAEHVHEDMLGLMADELERSPPPRSAKPKE